MGGGVKGQPPLKTPTKRGAQEFYLIDLSQQCGMLIFSRNFNATRELFALLPYHILGCARHAKSLVGHKRNRSEYI